MTLRDFIETDIHDRIYWETVETEWQLWDAPWEYDSGEEPFDAEQYRQKMLDRLSEDRDETRMRWGFQICVNDCDRTHIGWCNAYCIDGDHNYTQGDGFCTIGINIPAVSARRRGYATAAWKLFIEYLTSNGVSEIYTQTWSGNERLLGLASKLGFRECSRELGSRQVRGRLYDALTLRLNMDKFRDFAAEYTA